MHCIAPCTALHRSPPGSDNSSPGVHPASHPGAKGGRTPPIPPVGRGVDCKNGRVRGEFECAVRGLPSGAGGRRGDCKDGRVDGENRSDCRTLRRWRGSGRRIAKRGRDRARGCWRLGFWHGRHRPRTRSASAGITLCGDAGGRSRSSATAEGVAGAVRAVGSLCGGEGSGRVRSGADRRLPADRGVAPSGPRYGVGGVLGV